LVFVDFSGDLVYICCPAQVAKLVDAPSSGGGAARCAGSNPVLGTMKKVLHEVRDFLFGGVQSLLC